MRLLITTQAIDRNDPILGFFHRWVAEFAKHFEHVYVICLRKGEYDLPENVTVYSLGKEEGESRLKYIWNFYRTVYKLRGKYDAVFSHMNPHYITLAGPYWKLAGKPMFFWRNHARMNIMTRIAAFFAKQVFHTSPHACTARFKHAVQVPVGVDTDRFSFAPHTKGDVVKILSLGRISPVKRLELLVEAMQHFSAQYELHIYGDAPDHDRAYKEKLEDMAGDSVHFHPAVRNEDTPSVYGAHDIFVNLTSEGSMDKTVLEAGACGVQVVFMNTTFRDVFGTQGYVEGDDAVPLAERIVSISALEGSEDADMRMQARKHIEEGHSLKKLAEVLYTYIYDNH